MATLYGVSTGPGDSSLMTIKSVDIINTCNVLAVPRTKGEATVALDTVKHNCDISDKEIIYLDFFMTRDEEVLRRNYEKHADVIETYLKENKDVVMISIGDISLYSTFSYVSEIVQNRGYNVEIVPGVTSFLAAAAKSKKAIASKSEKLLIMPGTKENINEIKDLKEATNLVIMKGKGNVDEIKKVLKDKECFAVTNCTMEDERVYTDIDKICEEDYFTTIIAKQVKNNEVNKSNEVNKNNEEYVIHGKEKLRCGYTTGSCATAAAKAATIMLLSKEDIEEVDILTPSGKRLYLSTYDMSHTLESAKCAIKKDSGDDPDITNGIYVYALVEKIDNTTSKDVCVIIDGGEGVGRVTKPGLDQPVGNSAINSVPRKMITEAVMEVASDYDYHGGLKVTISVPGGEIIAKKTFNERLGILGGISIIGTSGIVSPMSNKAIIDTIRAEVSVRHEAKKKYLLYTIGNYGKTFLKDTLPDILDEHILCSNFIGDAIDIGLEYDFKSILIVGHIGKMIKLAAGIMNTHSSYGDARMDVIISAGVKAGVDRETLLKIYDCVMVDDALDILDKCGFMKDVIDIIIKRIEFYLKQKVKDECEIGAVIFSNKYGLLGKTSIADEIADKILKEKDV